MANNEGISLNSRNKYSGKKSDKIYITSETKKSHAMFGDPLVLNFKIMIDYDKPSGLFAPETNINSALAYLKRIGETQRYEMLKRWIVKFKDFIKNYDFLITEVTGIDAITNKPAGDMFTGEDFLTFTVKETSDMLCQSLITIYSDIWYDCFRQVEVIPVNLRKFDFSVLIFNSGYYNMELYDELESDLSPEETYKNKMFPTIKKLSNDFFVDNAKTYDFNHHMIILGNAELNTDESGKSFFASVSNEVHDDDVKNTLAINYRFGLYKGVFNNIFGEYDFVRDLAVSAAYDNAVLKKRVNTLELSKKEKRSNALSNVGDIFKTLAVEEANKMSNKRQIYKEKYFGKNTAIGNALTNLKDPKLIPKMVKNTVDLGIQSLEDATIGKFVTKVNNIILNNFSENFVDIYNKYGKEYPTNIVLEETPMKTDTTQDASTSDVNAPSQNAGIRYEVSNIYTRGGF